MILKGDNIARIIVASAKLQIPHKIISKGEGNIVNLDEVAPSERAKEIAEKTDKDPALVEVILGETKEIIRLGRNSIITENKNGIVCANAGVDKSNIEGEKNVALLPKDSDASAQEIRREIKKLTSLDVAVVISDTHGRPFRMGEINVAIGVAGIKPTKDRRGEKDLFGYVLKVKQTAIADELASAAELVIGKENEGVPVAIIRGYAYKSAENVSARELTRPQEAAFLRG